MAERVAIRVDASATMGLGHVKRCLALAHALRESGAEVIFVARALGLDVPALVRAEGIDCASLPAPGGETVVEDVPHARWAGVPWQVDAAQTSAALEGIGTNWLVVDHYSFDAHWHKVVAGSLSCRIAAIDDLADRALAVGVLIDHNLADDHRRKYSGLIDDGTVLLGGPRFALLGPSYATAPRYAFHREVRSVGIFMGGTDPANLGTTALLACRKAGFAGPIEIVTTRSNLHLAELFAVVAADGRTTLTVDLPELSVFYARHDLQVGAGGGAAWERCCIGAPTLAVVAAANQAAVVPALAALGAVAALPAEGIPTADALAAGIKTLVVDPERRASLANKARTVVDGLGSSRVAYCLLADSLRVRAATTDDAALIFGWRNHAATRVVSRNSEPISFDRHLLWLSAALSDPRRHLMVGSIGSVPVGVIRMDERDDGGIELSLYLDPALHGIGLGSALLAAGETWISPRLSSDHRFVAQVQDGNLASRRLFEAAGYRFSNEWWTKPIGDTAAFGKRA